MLESAADPVLTRCFSERSLMSMYFEVTAYDEEPEDPACGTSVCDSSSWSARRTPPPMPDEQQTLEGEPCAHWPTLKPADGADDCSERLSERLSATSLDCSLPPTDLLSMTPPADVSTRSARSAVRACWRLHVRDSRIVGAIPIRRCVGTPSGGRRCDDGWPERPACAVDWRGAVVLDQVLSRPMAVTLALRANVDISTCLSVKRIDVSNCKLKPESADVLGWLLRQNPHLQSLDVSHNALGVRGASAIGSALPHAPCLTKLRMHGTELCSAGGTDPNGLLELAAGIRAHPSLSKLGLRSNMIGACSTPSGLRALVAAIADAQTSIKSMDVSCNPLGCEGATLLAGLLASQPSLTRLEAASCTLAGSWGKVRDGVRALAAAVASSTTLLSLDLSDNAIGRESEAMDLWHLEEHSCPACPAVFLVEAIRQNTSLDVLRLHANHLVGDQAERLYEAWASHANRSASGIRL